MTKKELFLVILSAVERPIKTKAGFAGLKWRFTIHESSYEKKEDE